MNTDGKTGAKSISAPLKKVASLIVRLRFVIFLLFAAACVFCALSLGRAKVYDDIIRFLPETTETRRGISVMEKEFSTYASVEMMLTDVTSEEASAFAAEIKEAPHVTDVGFDLTDSHYRDGAALYSVSFDLKEDDDRLGEAREGVRKLAGDKECYLHGDVLGGYSDFLAREMLVVFAFCAVVILAVLLFTSRSFFELPIYAVVFAVAALLNKGTNFLLGEISSITDSVVIILQLALAIDYAIIFAHSFQNELGAGQTPRDATVSALARSIVEIASSSLTTVSGLAALTLMQFRLGYDLGTALAKSIVCSMLTVFLLMPCLMLTFSKLIVRTTHRSLVPNMERWGRFLSRRVPVFLILFAVVLPFAVIFSGKTEYAFSDASITEIIESESRRDMHKIEEVFGERSAVAVIVPGGDYEKEKRLIERLSSMDHVKNVIGIAGIEYEGINLTDKVTPEEISGFFGADPGEVSKLFAVYAKGKNDPSAAEEAPLIDLALLLFDAADAGLVPLTDEQTEMMESVRAPLMRGVEQLKGEEHDRIVMTVTLPAESREALDLLRQIRSAADGEYGEDDVLVTGAITSARDLSESYKGDAVLVSVLTIVFVFIILLFTFRSPVAAAVLVFVIQGSIWINFSISYLAGIRSAFVTVMITSAIQMGATIDYAIVIMSRYKHHRASMEKKEAMAKAVNDSFSTVVTSGTIMTAAGFLIGYKVSDVYVGHIGLTVGRGALISVILVLTVLPQLILLADRLIGLTTFRRRKKEGSGTR